MLHDHVVLLFWSQCSPRDTSTKVKEEQEANTMRKKSNKHQGPLMALHKEKLQRKSSCYYVYDPLALLILWTYLLYETTSYPGCPELFDDEIRY